jgi:hypothetical protein
MTSTHRPRREDLARAHEAFRAQESRDLFYRAATALVRLAREGAVDLTTGEAIAVLLRTWNSAYFRYTPNSFLWLLTIDDGTSVCAATLDNRWLRPAVRHWVGADSAWEVFGLFRQGHRTGIPLLAVIYVGLKWPR